MKILPYRWKKVADGMRVRVSEHFFYTDFGVCSDKKAQGYGRGYVSEGGIGSGFIERDSESHSYHEYIRRIRQAQRPTYWRLLFGLEPDFKRVQQQAQAALNSASVPLERRILECYVNALAIGKQEEYLERVTQGIKNKIGHKSSKFMVSVLSYYKNKISQLGNDMSEVEYSVKEGCTPEVYAAWCGVVEAFRSVAACRRVWYVNEDSRQRFDQVWFDLGTFDFIRSDLYLPLLRTTQGETLYLLPEHIIVARSSTDFKAVPIRRLTVICQELAIEETVETLSSRLGDAASMLRIPELKHTWYFNHVRPVMRFFSAFEHLKEQL